MRHLWWGCVSLHLEALCVRGKWITSPFLVIFIFYYKASVKETKTISGNASVWKIVLWQESKWCCYTSQRKYFFRLEEIVSRAVGQHSPTPGDEQTSIRETTTWTLDVLVRSYPWNRIIFPFFVCFWVGSITKHLTRWSGDVMKGPGHKNFNAVSHNRSRPEVLFLNLTWLLRGQISSVLIQLLLFAFSNRKFGRHGKWSVTFWQ